MKNPDVEKMHFYRTKTLTITNWENINKELDLNLDTFQKIHIDFYTPNQL